jgi:CRP/FNR family transcriptional regulator
MFKKPIYELLKEVKIFSSLEEKDLHALAKIVHIQNYNKESTLFMQGDISTSLMILVDGVVSIFKHDNKGNEITIGYFNRYALLAEPATLRRTPLPSSATFKTDGSVMKINIDKFETIMQTHPKIAYEVIQSLLQKIDLLQQNIHFNIASTSSEKILQFYEKNPTLSLDLKKYEIASILGMRAETFSRTIHKLEKEGQLKKISTGYKLT